MPLVTVIRLAAFGGQLIIRAFVDVSTIGNNFPHVTLVEMPKHNRAMNRPVETVQHNPITKFEHTSLSFL